MSGTEESGHRTISNFNPQLSFNKELKVYITALGNRHPRISQVVIWPPFEQEVDFSDVISRIAWYFSPFLDKIEKIITFSNLKNIFPSSPPETFDSLISAILPHIRDRLVVLSPRQAYQAEFSGDSLDDFCLIWRNTPPEARGHEPPLVVRLRRQNRVVEVDREAIRNEGSFFLWAGSRFFADTGDQIDICRERFAQAVATLGPYRRATVFGTGPSLSSVRAFDFRDSVCIISNSIVKNIELVEHLDPKFVVAGDPIFHAGCSAYAAAFRKALFALLELRRDLHFVCPLRDFFIYDRYAPESVRQRIIGVPFSDKSAAFNYNLRETFAVYPHPNILTLLLLPVAFSLSRSVEIAGCDGRPLDQSSYFWTHDKSAQFNDEMDVIKQVHPAFFKIDYNDYYLTHCENVASIIGGAEAIGHNVSSITHSYIPALASRSATPTDPRTRNRAVVMLDPDALNNFGHFLSYDARLRRACRSRGFGFHVLGNRNFDATFCAEWPELQRVFSNHSWEIGTEPNGHLEERLSSFKDELAASLDKLERGSPETDFVLHMYCGSIPHAIAIDEVLRSRPSFSALINLFFLSFVNYDAPGYYTKWADKMIRLAAGARTAICVPTPQLATGLRESFGVVVSVAAHPSTTFDDDDLIGVRRSAGAHAKVRVLFPGGIRLEKGFDLTVEATQRIAMLGASAPGLTLIVRALEPPKLPLEARDGLERLKLVADKSPNVVLSNAHLDDRAFAAFLDSGDIIVLPYRAEAFSDRTSGLVIDAMLTRRPLVVLPGTWLSSIVNRFGNGVVAKRDDAPALVDAILEAVRRKNEFEAQTAICRDAYLEKNSWNVLLSQIFRRAIDDNLADRFYGLGAPPLHVATSNRAEFSAHKAVSAAFALAAGSKISEAGGLSVISQHEFDESRSSLAKNEPGQQALLIDLSDDEVVSAGAMARILASADLSGTSPACLAFRGIDVTRTLRLAAEMTLGGLSVVVGGAAAESTAAAMPIDRLGFYPALSLEGCTHTFAFGFATPSLARHFTSAVQRQLVCTEAVLAEDGKLPAGELTRRLLGWRRAQTVVVLGNDDPQNDFLPEHPFDIDTIGIDLPLGRTLAEGFWPTYYVCLDAAIAQRDGPEIARRIRNGKDGGTRLFILTKLLLRDAPELAGDEQVVFWEDLSISTLGGSTAPITSAAGAVSIGLALGYRQIALVGLAPAHDAQFSGLRSAWSTEDSQNAERSLVDAQRSLPTSLDAACALATQYGAIIRNCGILSRLTNYERSIVESDLLKREWSSQSVRSAPPFAAITATVPAANPTDYSVPGSSASMIEPLDLPRSVHAKIDETAVVAQLLRSRRGLAHTMLDVGAHVGSSARYFTKLGWMIHCFEPDAANRTKLIERFRDVPNITIDPRAVSDAPSRSAHFFTSPESTGISGLHAFRDSHVQAAEVEVTTIAEVVAARTITSVDFLKIDVEGMDFSVLKGVPWQYLTPDVIECEFEDNKTRSLGHTYREVADFLTQKGYSVYVSEWHPIIRYGIRHDWRRVIPYPCPPLDENAWGNLLAFKKDPGLAALTAAFGALQEVLPDQGAGPKHDSALSMPQRSATRQVDDPFFRAAQNANVGAICMPTILVLGNGPSLRDIDLRDLVGVDTIGMNAAYRHWRRINWYPTYYACLDTELVSCHAGEIERMVTSADDLGIRLFLLRKIILEVAPKLASDRRVLFWEDWTGSMAAEAIPMVTTGAGATVFAMALGYNRVGLLGIDLNYVETLPEARVIEGKVLEIASTPARNPNYFFDDYQRAGDRYHLPNSVPGLHVNSFAGVASMARRLGVRILNGSASSKLTEFDKVPVSTLLAEHWPAALKPAASSATPAGAGAHAAHVDVWSIDPDSLQLAREHRTPLYRDKVLRRMLKKADLKRAWSAYRKLRKFDGIRYAFTHKDVLEAILTGKVASAWAHYDANGQSEGRFNTRGANAPCLGTVDDLMAVSFDGIAYLREHADVREAVLGGRIGSAAIHYRHHGIKETRRYPYCRQEAARAGTIDDLVPRYFDGLAYVERYPDVAAAVTSGAVGSGADHFKAFGAKEGRTATFAWTTAPKTGSQFDLLQRWSERQTKAQNAAIKATIRAGLAGISEGVKHLVDAGNSSDVSAEVAAAIALLEARVQADRVETDRTLAHLREDVGTTTREIETIRNVLVEKINAAVAALAPPSAYAHNRTLTATAIGDLGNHWAHVFDRAMTQNELRYLAQTATEAEKRCLGRFASPIETLLARLLALQSLAKPHIQVLEIGTLFGVGIAILYELSRTRFETIDITVIDPFEGFYGVNKPDIVTGMPVNRATFDENLDRLRVPRERVRVIQGMSEAPETVAAACDRAYDLVIIDGDHSYAGVERDFDLYGPMVAPGGLVIFDDYGASAWPDIKRYVDEKVMPLAGWEFLIAGHATAVFRKPAASTAQTGAAEAAAPVLATTE